MSETDPFGPSEKTVEGHAAQADAAPAEDTVTDGETGTETDAGDAEGVAAETTEAEAPADEPDNVEPETEAEAETADEAPADEATDTTPGPEAAGE